MKARCVSIVLSVLCVQFPGVAHLLKSESIFGQIYMQNTVSRFHNGCDVCFWGALIWTQLIAAVAIHCHPSVITLHSARNDPSGGHRPAQIPQLDT